MRDAASDGGASEAPAPRRQGLGGLGRGSAPPPAGRLGGLGLGPGLLGSLAEVFGDLGHESTLGWPGCPSRHHVAALGRSEPPLATHSGPEMPPSLRTRQKWMAMKITMTNGNISTCSTYHRSNVSRADLVAAEQHEPDLVAEHRGVAHHVRAHGDGPQRQLVPRQQVAGERQQQGERQQDDADHPVELAGRLVGAVVEDAGHVQEHRQHHQVRAPIGACCAPAGRTSPRSAGCRCRSRPAAASGR